MSKAAMLLSVDSKLSLSHVSSSESSSHSLAARLSLHSTSWIGRPPCIWEHVARHLAAEILLLGLLGDLLAGLQVHTQLRCQGMLQLNLPNYMLVGAPTGVRADSSDASAKGTHMQLFDIALMTRYLGGSGRIRAVCHATSMVDRGIDRVAGHLPPNATVLQGCVADGRYSSLGLRRGVQMPIHAFDDSGATMQCCAVDQA